MHHNENQFYQLAESSPDAIFIASQGRFAYVNPAALRLFGATAPDQLLGQSAMERIHPDDLPIVLARIARMQERGEPQPPLEETYLRLDGTPVAVEVSSVPFAYNGEPGGLVFVRDITQRKRAEEALRTSEERWKFALEGAGDGVWDWNIQTGEMYLSKREMIVLGYDGEEAMHTHIDEWEGRMHPEDEARRRAAIDRYFAGLAPLYTSEFRIRGRDGRWRWIFARGMLVSHTADGRPLRMIGTHSDITERKAAELELEKYRTRLEELVAQRTEEARSNETRFHSLVEQSMVGIFVIQAGRFRYVNPGFARIHGFADPREIVGIVQPADLLAPEDRERLEEITGCHFTEFVPSQVAFAGLRRDGSRIDLEASASSIDYEGRPAVIGMVMDVTERRRAQLALEAHQAQLEKEVAARTADLVAANKALQGFTYAASHDLKAPLGRINIFSGLLEQHYRERLEGDGLTALGFIRQNATRMTTLIEDLLAHAQIGEKILTCQPVDLQEAVCAILQEKSEDIRQAGAEIRLDLPAARVLADPHGLAQVLRNLLENALKYAARSAPPAIAIGARVEAGRCRLWVRDNGIGFDMAYHNRIFEIFHRLHTYEEFPGSGVGLALVKKAMDRMGGRVWAQSEPAQGAAFFLELPVPDKLAAADPIGCYAIQLGAGCAAVPTNPRAAAARPLRRDPMTARICLLPTQDDIIDFRLGHRPANILVRDFETAAEVRAYEDGIDAIGDPYDRIEQFTVSGAKVAYTRRTDDPEAEAVARAVEVEFKTPAEAEAYRQGLHDAEGLAAPLLIDDTDDRFEQLLAWALPSPQPA